LEDRRRRTTKTDRVEKKKTEERHNAHRRKIKEGEMDCVDPTASIANNREIRTQKIATITTPVARTSTKERTE
jgi:hypothetical protein